MTELLQQAFKMASELPEEHQDRLAGILMEELESERIWDELFIRPESEALLDRLADETLADYRAGLTEPLRLDEL